MIPINVDRNVGPSAYNLAASKGELLVTSAFHTMQGEGPFTGHPAVFLRLAGCNLGDKVSCPWCDTRFNFDEGVLHSIEGLQMRISQLLRNADLVVVTGGEPLLQWKVLDEFIWTMLKRFPSLHFQFETNGVLLDERILDAAVDFCGAVSFVVSPKVIGGRGYRPTPPEWRAYGNILSLKYVVSADPESLYHTPPADLMDISPHVPVYISGQTEYGPNDVPTKPGAPVSFVDLSRAAQFQTLANWSYAAKLALRHGFRVSFQTHLLAGVE